MKHSPQKFFIPHTTKSTRDAALDTILASIKYQFNWPVTDRRISSITYYHDRKVITAKVGELEQLERNYEVVAILESSLYMIVTRRANGELGPTILVNDQEVSEITDFVKPEQKPSPQLSAK